MAFDLDKLIAEREAKTPFTFTFDGTEYTLPSDIDVEVLQLLTDGDALEAMALLIGDEQWQRVLDSDVVLGAVALGELMNAYMEHLGVDLGESSASPRSLNRTARRSKRTSNGSTGSRSVSLAEVSPGEDSESS